MHRLLEDPAIAPFASLLGREGLKPICERELAIARASSPVPDPPGIVAAIVARLRRIADSELRGVVNATGILTHTNLGRSPLAQPALDAVAQIARGYSNLEYDLEAGRRGSRYEHATGLLCELTGAQAALLVNNCAAALLLALDTFARGREALVARGELVEIGGGLRVPEIVAATGAILREVGTTNRTHAGDFERALSPATAVLLRVHPSNYRIEGFTAAVPGRVSAELARRAGAIAIEDLGAGALCDLREYGLPHERTVGKAIADGIDLVTFSGDKLIGGPQAGIVVGRAHAIARMRANPLLRALRIDKMTLAALTATLRLHRDPQSRQRIPLYRMLAIPLQELRRRAERYILARPDASMVDGVAYAGGGALPHAEIPSIAVRLAPSQPNLAASTLRRNDPPIVARIEHDALLLDLRTIAPDEDPPVIAALATLA